MATLRPCVGTRVSLGLTATLLAIPVAVAPRAEELGHRLYHDSDYRHWKQPGTSLSCCSDQDCAPVRAELRHGRWFALRGRQWSDLIDEMGHGEAPVLLQAEWIAVPDEKILRVPNPAGESGHLCYAKGRVICFVPPDTGG